jgi:hypothetical protein
LVCLLPCLLARLLVFFCFKLTLLGSVLTSFTQNTPHGVTTESGSTYPNISPLTASSWLTPITQKQCQLFSSKPTETKESNSHNTGNGFTKHQTQWVVCRIIIDLLVLKHPKKSSNSIYLLQSVLPSKYAAIDRKHFWLSMNPSSLPPLLCSILLWGPRSNESNTSRFENCFKIR